MTNPMNAADVVADVIVIGAGVVGGLAAWKLAQQGIDVVVLEAGPEISRADSVARFKRDRFKGTNAPYQNVPWAPVPDDSGPDRYGNYYVQDVNWKKAETKKPKKQFPFKGIYVRGVGGASWHWTGHAERFQPNDFRTQSAYGVGVDWPISYDELEPYYYQAEVAWGVAGDADCIAPPRDNPYPMPVVPMSYLDHQVAKAVEAVENPREVRTAPYPHCRNSQSYDGRPQCCGNASCRLICPIAAKYDASVHVMKAVKEGARLTTNAVVTRIEVGDDGRISHLVFRQVDPDTFSRKNPGPEMTAKAKTYILATHAIEVPRLLLLSAGERAPNGVANFSGEVGRNLMGQVDVNARGHAPDAVYPYRGPVSATGGITGLRDGEFRRHHAAAATFIINGGFDMTMGPFQEAARALDQGLLGGALRDEIRRNTATEVMLNSSVEVMPSAENRVSLAKQTDDLGLARPHIDYRLDDYTLDGVRVAQERHVRILTQMGVKDIEELPIETSGAIIAGTARMGDDPGTSVVDRMGRSHDHANLWIIGTCNYPTSTICSPSLTAAALSIRAAEAIAENFTDV